MNGIERYQRWQDLIFQEVDAKAFAARDAKNAAVFQSVIAAAVDVGITVKDALRRVRTHVPGYKAGTLALIEEVRDRRSHRQTADRMGH